MRILLASQSPRRKELLRELGYNFEVVSVDCDEVYPENLPLEKVAAYLSLLKANAFRKLEKNEILLTADTIVVIDHEILGKPKDKNEAVSMLLKLSGKKHHVYTAITLKTFEKTTTETDIATVYFNKILPEEALFYVEKQHPLDKAGSYGIQDWVGMAKVQKIEGSFYTIMGLPTHLVHQILSKMISEN